MRKSKRREFRQNYNAQAVVDLPAGARHTGEPQRQRLHRLMALAPV
jgi:hypothetical protein